MQCLSNCCVISEYSLVGQGSYRDYDGMTVVINTSYVF